MPQIWSAWEEYTVKFNVISLKHFPERNTKWWTKRTNVIDDHTVVHGNMYHQPTPIVVNCKLSVKKTTTTNANRKYTEDGQVITVSIYNWWTAFKIASQTWIFPTHLTNNVRLFVDGLCLQCQKHNQSPVFATQIKSSGIIYILGEINQRSDQKRKKTATVDCRRLRHLTALSNLSVNRRTSSKSFYLDFQSAMDV
jgi:hypothetical protein